MKTPTKINVSEYPEGADARTLLEYKIAVMQAALGGAKIEARVCWAAPIDSGVVSALRNCGIVVSIPLDGKWYPYEKIPGLDGPNFNWAHYDYRVARPEPAKPRYFRFSDGDLFLVGHRECDQHCIGIGKDGRATFVYIDGRVEETADFNLDYCLEMVRRGTWEEFDGRMEVPQTKLVPWTLDTVPLPCVVRRKLDPHFKYCPIVANERGLVLTPRIGDIRHASVTWADLFACCEHSLDHGKTWKPCGTEVAS